VSGKKLRCAQLKGYPLPRHRCAGDKARLQKGNFLAPRQVFVLHTHGLKSPIVTKGMCHFYHWNFVMFFKLSLLTPKPFRFSFVKGKTNNVCG
jgi:hypothetical protein